MHEISSGPCEEMSRRNATPLPGADREPRDHAQDEPVEHERVDRHEPERDPAREREQRHLDVVEHHLRGERGRLGGVEVAALDGRVRRALELGGHQARGGRRIHQCPTRTRAAPAPSAAPTRRRPATAARPAAPSSRGRGSATRTAAAPSARRPPRGRAARAVRAVRRAGRRGSADGRTRGPRRPRGRARRAAAPRSAPSRSGLSPRLPQRRVELAPARGTVRFEAISAHHVGMEYEDRREIATPEGVQLALPLAGIGTRFMSTMIDLALVPVGRLHRRPVRRRPRRPVAAAIAARGRRSWSSTSATTWCSRSRAAGARSAAARRDCAW